VATSCLFREPSSETLLGHLNLDLAAYGDRFCGFRKCGMTDPYGAQWVQKHRHFGGDPANVTIFAHPAAAAVKHG